MFCIGNHLLMQCVFNEIKAMCVDHLQKKKIEGIELIT